MQKKQIVLQQILSYSFWREVNGTYSPRYSISAQCALLVKSALTSLWTPKKSTASGEEQGKECESGCVTSEATKSSTSLTLKSVRKNSRRWSYRYPQKVGENSMGDKISKDIAAAPMSLESKLEVHLQGNHYPPIDRAFIPVAILALKWAKEGLWEEQLTYPNGLKRTVADTIEGMHLEFFIEE